jgi:hypothetical protein
VSPKQLQPNRPKTEASRSPTGVEGRIAKCRVASVARNIGRKRLAKRRKADRKISSGPRLLRLADLPPSGPAAGVGIRGRRCGADDLVWCDGQIVTKLSRVLVAYD